MSGTPALPSGTVLSGRFELLSVLGRGGFGITYLAQDLQQDDECVVKELAPTGAHRMGNNLDLSAVPSTSPQRIRRKFLEEAELIAKLEIPGILRLRESFEDLGTAYFVTDMLPGARTLERVMVQEGRMRAEPTLDILFQLMTILEQIHEKGILHRDLKPSNILLSPKDEVYLIDFGAAREWHADSAALQTVLFTPGYAPLEQLSDRGRRGPATDVYALCATGYHMLAGIAPRPSAERADGTDLAPLTRLRPDLDQNIVQGITAGLRLRFKDRPQSIAELRRMFLAADPGSMSSASISNLDSIALRLQTFSFDRNECPVCAGILERPKPLKTGVCPVCREGFIKPRDLSDRLCPHCRNGVLHLKGEKSPILFCPMCKQGELHFRRRGILAKTIEAECPTCKSYFSGDSTLGTYSPDDGESVQKPWSEWQAGSGRTHTSWICDMCRSQYDVLPSGRWRAYGEGLKPGQEYYPDEWAKIAGGLSPDAGNSYCDCCGADFWLDDETITLLQAHHDHFRFAARYLEQNIALGDLPWFGVGKSSGNRGLTCPQCDTEFDEHGEYLTLVHTPSVRLAQSIGRALTIEDWHRMSQGVPLTSEIVLFYERLDDALRQSFMRGEISFDSRNPDLLWNGPAKLLEYEDGEWVEIGDGPLMITSTDLTFGRMLRKWKVLVTAIRDIKDENGLVVLFVSGIEATRAFDVERLELTVELASGPRKLLVDNACLVESFRSRLGNHAQA